MGVMMIVRSLCYIVTGTETRLLIHPFFKYIGRGYFLKIPVSLWIFIIFFGITYFLLGYTDFGRKVYAVGANPDASYLAGINVKRIRTWGLIFSSVSASIAGIILASQIGAAVPSAGAGSELDIVAAVLLGGLSLSGGKGKVSGTLLGLIILLLLNNGLTLLGLGSYYQMMVRGIVLLLAVVIDSIRGGGYK